jgi:hypothetical protein
VPHLLPYVASKFTLVGLSEKREFAWFRLSAAMPALSIDARRHARLPPLLPSPIEQRLRTTKHGIEPSGFSARAQTAASPP